MKTTFTTQFFGIALTFLSGMTNGQSSADEIDWRRIPAAAQQEARRLQRPILVYASPEFCGYCRKLEGKTWSDENVPQMVRAGFVPLAIDGQRDAAIAFRLGVRGFPAVIVLSAERRIIAQRIVSGL